MQEHASGPLIAIRGNRIMTREIFTTNARSSKLTAIAIEKLKPGPIRREILDGGQPGLYFILQSSGKASWAFRYRFGGRPRKLTIGPYPAISLQDARAKAAAAQVSVAKGIDPSAEKQARKRAASTKQAPLPDLVEMVAAEFIQRYVKHQNRPSTAREYVRLLNKEVVPLWCGRRFGEIVRRDVNSLLDGIVDRGSPVAANRVFAVLRKLCRWAVSREIIEHSPCDGVMPRTTERPRDRVLDDVELRRVWHAAETMGYPFAPIVKLLILTGQRRGEVAGMRWGELDLATATWTIPAARTKNKRQHAVPLSPQAVDILTGLSRTDRDLVFPARERTKGAPAIGRPVNAFSKAKRNLDAAIGEMPPWTVHDLRRSCASGLARIGVDLPVIERCLNHVSGSFGGIVGVYQKHKYEDSMRRAMDAWGRHLDGARPENVIELRRDANV
jgi:integrase